MSEATTTTDHDEIRRWAEERGGRPSVVRTGKGRGGILRFDFGEKDEKLEEVSWEEFFAIFDENDIALLHQDEIAGGKTSRFFKFVARPAEKKGAAKKASAKKASAERVSGAKPTASKAAAGGKSAEKKPATKAAADKKPATAKKASSGTGSAAKKAGDDKKPAAKKPAAPAKKSAAKKTGASKG